MQTMMKRLARGLAAAALIGSTAAAADVVINVQQVGEDIQLSLGGSLNTFGLVLASQAFVPPAGIDPGAAFVRLGMGTFDRYAGLSGPTFFGNFAFSAAWPTSGTPFGVFGNQGYLYLPTGYVSGSPLSATGIIPQATLNGILASAGTYVYTLPAGNSDTITVQIGGTPLNFPGQGGETGAIPEPASWAMLITGFGLVGARARRRRLARAVVTA